MALFHAKFSCNLEILYLGGNYVRVVCVRVRRKTQKCATQQGLVTRSRDWLAAGKSPKRHICEACRGAKESRQLSYYRQES